MSKRFLSTIVSGVIVYGVVFGIVYVLQFLPWQANVGIWLAGVAYALFAMRRQLTNEDFLPYWIALTWFVWAFGIFSSECDYYVDRLFGIPKPE